MMDNDAPAPGVIDAHLHLDDRIEGPAANAVHQLLVEMHAAGVAQAIVLHLRWQRWALDEVAQALQTSPKLVGFANVDPTVPGAEEDLNQAVALGYRGLKLHPRLQRFRPDDEACVRLVRRAGELNMPVIIDCFPDGDWLMAGLHVLQYAELARKAPATKVIVAHAAGHHCLDLLMLAKRVPNLWFDLSYSLLYYDSPVVDALFYCMKSIRYEKVLFGTDYPDRPLGVSVAASLGLFEKFGVVGEARDKVLWRNARQLLQAPSA